MTDPHLAQVQLASIIVTQSKQGGVHVPWHVALDIAAQQVTVMVGDNIGNLHCPICHVQLAGPYAAGPIACHVCDRMLELVADRRGVLGTLLRLPRVGQDD